MTISPARILMLLQLLSPCAQSAQPGDLDRIAEEGMQRSQVRQPVEYLTEVIGPRLTASPASHAAARWALEHFRSLGLARAQLHEFDFGQGWSYSGVQVHAEGIARPLKAIPEAWTPGTDGILSGEGVILNVGREADLDRFRGKLAGRIALIGVASPVAPREPPPLRLQHREIDRLTQTPGEDGDGWKPAMVEFLRFRVALDEFLAREGAIAVLWPSERAGGVLNATGYTHRAGRARRLPQLVVAREDYNALARRIAAGHRVRLRLESKAQFHPENSRAYNVLGDIPGATDEIVIAGAHLDSWHAGSGATDNATGVAAVIEAARILRKIGVAPKRTIRFALWQGEEQGLLGSQAYVAERLARRPEPHDPAMRELPPFMRQAGDGELTIGDEYGRVCAYLNMDAGGGRIRGMYAGPRHQQRIARWLEPLERLGATIVSPHYMPESDDWSFRNVDVPGYGFIQDPLDYHARTHHTDLDVLDYVRMDELEQAAVVIASVLYLAANEEGECVPGVSAGSLHSDAG